MELLVVDDDEDVAMAIAEMLALHDQNPFIVSSGEEAVEVFSARRDSLRRFDAVFTDIIMPGMNGIELSHHLKKLAPQLPIVAFSGAPQKVLDSFELKSSLFFCLLRKPYSAEDLLFTLHRIDAFLASP